MKVRWSPRAIALLKETAEVIGQSNPQAANKWVDSLFASVNRLEQFPASGAVVPEVGRKDIREVLHGEYRVIYQIRSSEIWVISVIHGRRLFRFSEFRL